MNKKIFRYFSLVLAILLVVTFIPMSGVQAASKKGWVKKKGYKYYYSEDGKMQTGFTKVGKDTYYFTPKAIKAKYKGKSVTIAPKGSMLKGWYKIKKKYYYFDRNSGKLAVNKTVDSIKTDKKGAAKSSDHNMKKINLMILAREKMQCLTKASDSKEAKRRACFDYCKSISYIGYHFLKNERSKSDWDIIFASDVLDPTVHSAPGGECTAMACTFAYMAHECGYKTVYVVDDDPSLKGDNHSWVEIDGKIFDSLFARTSGKGGDGANYNADYSGGDTGHIRINTRDISTGKETHK